MLARIRSPWAWGSLLAAVAVVVVVVLATGGGDDDEIPLISDIERGSEIPIVIEAGVPIVVGVSAPLSGPDAALGLEAVDAAAVGVERWKAENGGTIGGHEIEIHAEDDGCSRSDITEIAAGHLLRGEGGHIQIPGLVGIIGPTCSAGAAAVIPDYAASGIVMISGSTTRTDLTLNQPDPRFFFRTAFTNANEGALQARYIVGQLEADTIYVIDDGEAFGVDLADAAQASLEESGRVVKRESVERGTVDFSGLAATIAADNPDAVVFEGFNPEAALLYRQLRDAGYGEPFISGDGAISVSDFIEPLGDLAEGAAFAGCPVELPEDVLASYVSIAGDKPSVAFAAQFIDAVTILLDAVASVAEEQPDGSLLIQPLDLREAIATPELLAGASGAIAFDENGDRVGQGESVGLFMCRVEEGEFVNFRF